MRHSQALRCCETSCGVSAASPAVSSRVSFIELCITDNWNARFQRAMQLPETNQQEAAAKYTVCLTSFFTGLSADSLAVMHRFCRTGHPLCAHHCSVQIVLLRGVRLFCCRFSESGLEDKQRTIPEWKTSGVAGGRKYKIDHVGSKFILCVGALADFSFVLLWSQCASNWSAMCPSTQGFCTVVQQRRTSTRPSQQVAVVHHHCLRSEFELLD